MFLLQFIETLLPLLHTSPVTTIVSLFRHFFLILLSQNQGILDSKMCARDCPTRRLFLATTIALRTTHAESSSIRSDITFSVIASTEHVAMRIRTAAERTKTAAGAVRVRAAATSTCSKCCFHCCF